MGVQFDEVTTAQRGQRRKARPRAGSSQLLLDYFVKCAGFTRFHEFGICHHFRVHGLHLLASVCSTYLEIASLKQQSDLPAELIITTFHQPSPGYQTRASTAERPKLHSRS